KRPRSKNPERRHISDSTKHQDYKHLPKTAKTSKPPPPRPGHSRPLSRVQFVEERRRHQTSPLASAASLRQPLLLCQKREHTTASGPEPPHAVDLNDWRKTKIKPGAGCPIHSRTLRMSGRLLN